MTHGGAVNHGTGVSLPENKAIDRIDLRSANKTEDFPSLFSKPIDLIMGDKFTRFKMEGQFLQEEDVMNKQTKEAFTAIIKDIKNIKSKFFDGLKSAIGV